MNQLFFLGKDSGFENENTAAYIIKNNKLLLIDCGTDVFKKLKNKDKEHNFLKNKDEICVIITHLHNDHAGSLSQLILYCFHILNKKISIYSKCKHLKEYLNISGVLDNYYALKKSENITFIKTTHSKNLDSYGINIKLNNKNIVYTSDTNSIEPFYKYLTKNTDFYVDASISNNKSHFPLIENLDKLNELTKNEINVFLMHIDNLEKTKEIIKNTNIHICDEYHLTKKDIINILKYYNFNNQDYLVISGAAMVLYGFKEYTRDIDIAVNDKLYKKILSKYNCKFEKINKYNEEVWFVDEIINFSKSFYTENKNYIEKIPVQTEKDLINLKKDLNREKDLEEIKKINYKLF